MTSEYPLRKSVLHVFQNGKHCALCQCCQSSPFIKIAKKSLKFNFKFNYLTRNFAFNIVYKLEIAVAGKFVNGVLHQRFNHSHKFFEFGVLELFHSCWNHKRSGLNGSEMLLHRGKYLIRPIEFQATKSVVLNMKILIVFKLFQTTHMILSCLEKSVF